MSIDHELSNDNTFGHPQWGHIKSFTTQRTSISPAQKRALETLLPQYGVPYRPESFDFRALFAQPNAPLVLEIGCGMGETTAAIAAANPHINFVGIEVYPAGVGALLARVVAAELSNVRVMQHDAVDVINHMFAEASLDGIHIYFPDPWRKARHHKRRLIQPPFVTRLCSRLKQGAYLHTATDWEDYAVQMLDVLKAETMLKNCATDNGYSPAENPLLARPETKFEARGLRLGHGVWDCVFTKI